MLGARALGSPGPPAPLGGPGRPLLRPAAAGDGDHPSKQSPRFSLGWLQNLTSTAKSDFADIADLADMADFSLEVQFVKTDQDAAPLGPGTRGYRDESTGGYWSARVRD